VASRSEDLKLIISVTNFELTYMLSVHQSYRRTDGQTDDSWAPDARGPAYSWVFFTLTTRIANLLCIIHSALSRLSCTAASASRHADLLIARLAPRARWAEGQTDTTYQPANRTAAVLPVASCKLGTYNSNTALCTTHNFASV